MWGDLPATSALNSIFRADSQLPARVLPPDPMPSEGADRAPVDVDSSEIYKLLEMLQDGAETLPRIAKQHPGVLFVKQGI